MFSLANLPRALSFAAAVALCTTGCDHSPSPGKPLPPAEGPSNPGEAPQPGESDPPPGTRIPLVPADHPRHSRLEGTDFGNNCTADTECFRGGCGGEICSAENGINSTCEVLDVQIPDGAGCGCVSGSCIWYTADGQTLEASQGVNTGNPPSNPPSNPPTPAACGEKTCAAGESCLSYYGIAGPKGPRFQTCAIPCGPKRTCPKGKSCVTVSDGPGDVCQ
ncbi:MAG: hypothetical protein ACPG4T_09865 [Nannocystaceae bacterium]